MIRVARIILMFTVAALFMAESASAGILETGMGARAVAMGQAQVAAANDASAMSFNPAALTYARQYWDLQTREYFIQYQNVGTHSKLYVNDIEQEDPYTASMLVGSVLPLTRNITAGIQVYYPSDTTILIEAFRGPTISRYRATRWFYATGGAAYKLTEKISVGFGGCATLGFKGGDLNLDISSVLGLLGLDLGAGGTKDINTAFRIDVVLTGGYEFGALYSPFKWLNIGAFYRWKLGNRVLIPVILPESDLLSRTQMNVRGYLYVTNPAQFSFGVALMPTKNITVALDLQRDLWSTIKPELRFEAVQGDLGVKNYKKYDLDDVWWPKVGIEWKDRLGGKYSRMDYAIRAGYSYYTSPFPEKLEGRNTLDNDAHYYSGGFSIGYTPRRYVKYFSIDYFYQYTDLVEREHRDIEQNPALLISDGYVIYQGFGLTLEI